MVAIGLPFMRIMLGANAVIVFLFLLNGIFRGAGDAAIALRVLIVANGSNIILDPLLIFGVWIFPELGVTGAAVATVIGRGIGVAYAAWALFGRSGGRLVVKREHWRFEPDLLLSLARISATAVLQLLVTTATWSVLVAIIAVFGSVAIAGYQIGLRIFIFLLLPVVGIANAAATLVGQNLGAGKPDRAERSVWIAGASAAGILGSLGLVFVMFSRPIVGIFTADEAIAGYAADCLRIVGYGYAFYGLAIVTESVQRCRRHMDADLDQSCGAVDVRDTAGIRVGAILWPRPAWCVLVDQYRIHDMDDRRRIAVPPREMEAKVSVGRRPYCGRIALWPFPILKSTSSRRLCVSATNISHRRMSLPLASNRR